MSCFSSALTQRKLIVQCAPPSPRTRRKDQSATSPSKCSRGIYLLFYPTMIFNY